MKVLYVAVLCLWAYVAGVQTMLWRINHNGNTLLPGIYKQGFNACLAQF